MKHIITLLAASFLGIFITVAENELQIFDHASFYDGYLTTNIPDYAPDQGYKRLSTSQNAVKLTPEQLEAIGTNLRLVVDIFPVCDNYDRIGSVFLTLLPKGTADYAIDFSDSDPVRIEVARFITPFMNRNRIGDLARYQFQVNDLARILRDSELRAKYDLWMELMVFGVPYAAQTQVAGCADCNETFRGSLTMVTDDTAALPVTTNVMVPIATRSGDWCADRGINNYNPACTDEIGKTVKTYSFTVPEACKDGRIVLIMSNHGAGQNGEEYIRRHHYVYVDNNLKLEFIPGRQSCEPFRARNSQANGIYGRTVKSNAIWQSFSNWCPGDKIDIRYIDLDSVAAGPHTVRIEVPDAEFFGQDGYFPVSMYFQGDTAGKLPAHPNAQICWDKYDSDIKVDGNTLTVSAPKEFELIEIYNEDGKLMLSSAFPTINISQLPPAYYQVAVIFATGIESHYLPINR